MQHIILYNYNGHTLRGISGLKSVLIKHGHCTKWEGSNFFNGQNPNNLLSDQYLMTIRRGKCFHRYISSVMVVCTQTGKVSILHMSIIKKNSMNPCLPFKVNLSYYLNIFPPCLLIWSKTHYLGSLLSVLLPRNLRSISKEKFLLLLNAIHEITYIPCYSLN